MITVKPKHKQLIQVKPVFTAKATEPPLIKARAGYKQVRTNQFRLRPVIEAKVRNKLVLSDKAGIRPVEASEDR